MTKFIDYSLFAVKTRRATAVESRAIENQINRAKRRAAIKRAMSDIFAGTFWALLIVAPFYFYLMGV